MARREGGAVTVVCTCCSASLYPDDVFCVQCGTRAPGALAAASAAAASGKGETRALAALRTGLMPVGPPCPRCSVAVFPDDRFCPHCGVSLEAPPLAAARTPVAGPLPAAGAAPPGDLAPSRSCPGCAASIYADDTFCVSCGTRVGALEGSPAVAEKNRPSLRAAGTRVWASISSGATSITPPCGSCGAPTVVGDRFCQQCGHAHGGPEEPASLSCPKCKTALFADDTFCVSCGTRVGQGAPAGPGTIFLRPGTRVMAALDSGRTSMPLACTSCSSPMVPGDRFCQSCGIQVGEASDIDITAEIAQSRSGAAEVSLRRRNSADEAWDQVRKKLEQLTIGEYDIAGELGRGGMAAVYLAHDLSLNRKVAIKVMSPGLLLGSGMVERFKREAKTVANLNHPHIIAIYTVRNVDDLHFFVMKFVEGNSLEQVLDCTGSLSIDAIRLILYHVGSGLGYAHRRGIVHRDIKPANIVIDTDGNAIVMDFGIAKVSQDVNTTMPGQTQAGTVVGTPAYMSPEQCLSSAITGASDQYSLGIVAYEMLTGRPPFAGPSFSIMQAHTQAAPPPVGPARPDCPSELEAAVMRMLAKTPAERFPSMAEALDALGAKPVGEGAAVHTEVMALAKLDASNRKGERPQTPVSPFPGQYRSPGRAPAKGKRKPWLIGLGAVGVAALVAGYFVTRSNRPASAPSDSTAAPVAPGAAPVAAVKLSTTRDSVLVDQTVVIRATVTDPTGNSLAGKAIAWASSDSLVASVSGAGTDGTIKGRKPGRVTITASSDGKQQTADVSVTAAKAGALSVSASTRELAVGETTTLTAILTDSSGKRVPNPPIEWRSGAPAAITVSKDGAVVAKEPGRFRITATSGKQTGAVDLVVRAARPALITVALAQSGALVAGRQTKVRATIEWEKGTTGSMAGLTWRTSDPLVATVAASDTSGTATVALLKEGDVSIIAEAAGVRGTTTLQVRGAQTLSLELSKSAVLFEAQVGGPPPAEQTIAVTVANAGEGERPAAGAPDYGSGATGWLTATLQGAALQLHPNPKDLAAGSYRATVPVSAGSVTRSVAVTLTLTEPARAAPVVAGGDAELEKARSEIEALLESYVQALRAKDTTQIRALYPGISERGLSDILKVKGSDFELQLRRGVPLKAGTKEGTVEGEVIAGGIAGSRAGNVRLIYTFSRAAGGWRIAGLRAAGG